MAKAQPVLSPGRLHSYFARVSRLRLGRLKQEKSLQAESNRRGPCHLCKSQTRLHGHCRLTPIRHGPCDSRQDAWLIGKSYSLLRSTYRSDYCPDSG